MTEQPELDFTGEWSSPPKLVPNTFVEPESIPAPETVELPKPTHAQAKPRHSPVKKTEATTESLGLKHEAKVKVLENQLPLRLQPQEPGAKGPWIQYNGVATVRVITPSDWKSAGVDSNKYCEWSYMNQKRLPRSMFTAHELQYLLQVDGRFTLETD